MQIGLQCTKQRRTEKKGKENRKGEENNTTTKIVKSNKSIRQDVKGSLWKSKEPL